MLAAISRSMYETTPLWSLVLIYGLAACLSHINIGHRHILPIYAPLVILIGAAATIPSRRWVLLPLALAALLAAETLYYFPNYVPYMNQLVGGPSQGWRVLGDSSQEWGGELPALKRWIDTRRERHADNQHARNGQPDERQGGERIYFSYFGSAWPAYYNIAATQLPSFYDLRYYGQRNQHPKDFGPLLPGTYCISASQLMICRPRPMGPWNADYEETYQWLRTQVQPFEQAADMEARTALLRQTPALVTRILPAYERYRFARLCAYLRTRCQPVEQINYAFLIFDVTQHHLDEALTGPPPELRQRVEAGE